jgi:hypothetical protein
MLSFRRLAIGFWRWRTGFNPKIFRVFFPVQGHVSLLVTIIPPTLCTSAFTCHGHYMTLANDGLIKWHRHNVTAVRGDLVANRWSKRNPHDEHRYNAKASVPTLLPFFHKIQLHTVSVLPLSPVPQNFTNTSRNISKPYEYLLCTEVCYLQRDPVDAPSKFKRKMNPFWDYP